VLLLDHRVQFGRISALVDLCRTNMIRHVDLQVRRLVYATSYAFDEATYPLILYCLSNSPRKVGLEIHQIGYAAR
jgi:hypothetical protein